jgi:Zn finger protein HypA/HybF involved in hydrogenase expression
VNVREKIRQVFGIRHPVMRNGILECWQCACNLTGQASPDHGMPIRCPRCRAKNFPDYDAKMR